MVEEPKPDAGEGGSPKAVDGDAIFRKGFGQGKDKGRSELLQKLGFQSEDELTGALGEYGKYKELAKQQQAEQGKFQELWSQADAENQKLKSQLQEHQKFRSEIEKQQQVEYDELAKSLTDSQRATLEDLPVHKRLSIAKLMTKSSESQELGAKAGGGTKPADKGGKSLEYYARKQWPNLTPEEKQEVARLQAADDMSIEELRNSWRATPVAKK